ncbi:MAG: hypothetical protein RIT45_842 [Pseudomonadota bacterium]|jgi:deoxyadenosine/deoxycytidine kinase
MATANHGGTGTSSRPGRLRAAVAGATHRDVNDAQPRFIAIAGTIGAGKSTLTSFLERRFSVRPFYEPNDSNPYLEDFYADMPRFAFHSQMYFLSAKFRAHLELARLLDANPATVFAQDRTIYEDAEIFAHSLHDAGVMQDRDFETYRAMYLAIRDTLPRPDLLIYLRCSVKGSRRRIRLRGRASEQGLDVRYLRRLHKAYERWFDDYDLGPKLVIETEQIDYLRDLVDRADLVAQLERLLGTSAASVRARALDDSNVVAGVEAHP